MHGVVWNSPYRINNSRKERGKETLSKEEYKKIEERQKANSIKFEEYMKYLENKYGKDLDATDKYYSTMIKEWEIWIANKMVIVCLKKVN